MTKQNKNSLKDRLARLCKIKAEAERADKELWDYSNAEEVEDRLRKKSRALREEADEMFEVIKELEAIISIQHSYLQKAFDASDGAADAIPAQNVLYEALEKSNKLMNGGEDE